MIIRKTFSNAFDIASRFISMKDVNLPNRIDTFDCNFYDVPKENLEEITLELGQFGVKNTKINSKIFAYNDIESDNYENSCGFWYRNLKLPKELSKKSNYECCFEFILNNNNHFICLIEKYHCILKMKMLLKGIKTGCLDSQSNNKGLLLSDLNEKVSENIKRNPNTEITGEKMNNNLLINQKYNLTELRTKNVNRNIYKHITSEENYYDKENFLWSGWLFVTNLPDSSKKISKTVIKYVNISIDSLKISENFLGNVNEILNNTYLDIFCKGNKDNNGICYPMEYLKYYQENINVQENLEVNNLEKIINEGVAKVGNEKLCVILQWNVNSFIKRKMFCIIDSSENYRKQFVESLTQNYELASRIMPISAFSSPFFNSNYEIEYFSENEEHSKIIKVIIIIFQENLNYSYNKNLIKK